MGEENIKSERKGFAVSGKSDSNKKQDPMFIHSAWETFLENNFPADERDNPQYLTTSNILERLNEIILDESISEANVFQSLKLSGFKQLPRAAGLFLWMVKSATNEEKTE